jgi:hypothetical protein
MKLPSMVSSRLMPAAKRTGSVRIAYQGRPLAAPVPAMTRKATSVAVSKPRPNKMPSGYIFQGASMRRPSGPKNRFIRPRLFSWASSSSSL